MVVRNPRGYIEPKYKNLGKSKVVRIPIEFVPMFDDILSICDNWDNENRDYMNELSKLVNRLYQASQE